MTNWLDPAIEAEMENFLLQSNKCNVASQDPTVQPERKLELKVMKRTGNN